MLSLLLLPLLTPNVRTVHVSPFKSHQNYEHFKRLTLHCEPAEVEFIQGFDYELGYTYTLEVQERRFEEILSDGTQAEYPLELYLPRSNLTHAPALPRDPTCSALSLLPPTTHY